ncbi:MAG TPA: NAD-dependent epimerase/dehydratase family protein [Sandaracinaceae bacterium LLY-WYZ-13_1]|nr:NAD-dependent epimerase/dehydratase family protein [Sandaracinaceae bacterium LLY-WYZ-13_1]
MSGDETKTVLVTGAAGTVGNYVIPLAEAAGYRVVANDLTAKGVQQPVRGEVRPGDLRDEAFLERLVDGCDAVIHTAALLDVGAPADALRETNVEVVARLHEAAAKAGVSRFVQVSTAMLYAPGQDGPLTEDARIEPRGEHGQSKLGAEEVLRARGDEGPAWTILRPAPLYGRRGRHFAAALLAVGPVMRLVTPILPRPSGGPVATLVHAEDVARAAVFVLEREDTRHEVYNVADEDALTLGDRVTETFNAYGLPSVGAGSLPRAVLDRVARLFVKPGAYHTADSVALGAWRLVVLRHGLKTALRVRLDREALTLLYDDLVVDASKLRALGWLPRYPRFAEGWRQVLRWYQAERWVPRYA